MIVVTGATGHVGSALVEELLKRGKRVRAVARQSERMARLRELGADSFRADLGDGEQLRNAFESAEAVFTMIPPNLASEDLRAFQNLIGDALVEAIRRSGARYVVNLSSVGAQLAEKTGPVIGLHDMEQKLDRLSGVNVLHLRPVSFMENVFFGLPLIKTQGIHGSPLAPDLKIPMIATRDIAQVAARRLASLDFEGKSVRELLGQRDLSMAEVTNILGGAIDKPLRYVQFSYQDTERALADMGASTDVAAGMVEMYRSQNEGSFRPTEERRPENTTPTRFEQFAREVFAPAYRAE